MMMGKKETDGRYYLRGYVSTSPRQRNVYIEFMIDTSQRFSTISKPDAEKNNVKLESLRKEKGKFKVGKQPIDAYVLPYYTIHITNQSGKLDYSKILPEVYVPLSNISANSLEPDHSRLGLDFLENYLIEFQTLGIDRDQSIILKENPSVV
jgi:hypothetical protein